MCVSAPGAGREREREIGWLMACARARAPCRQIATDRQARGQEEKADGRPCHCDPSSPSIRSPITRISYVCNAAIFSLPAQLSSYSSLSPRLRYLLTNPNSRRLVGRSTPLTIANPSPPANDHPSSAAALLPLPLPQPTGGIYIHACALRECHPREPSSPFLAIESRPGPGQTRFPSHPITTTTTPAQRLTASPPACA